MAGGFTAALGTIASLLPYLDLAIKDKNYTKVKEYQKQINQLTSAYNIHIGELNEMLSRYQNKYSYAVESLQGTVRGSTANRKALKNMRDSKLGISSTQSDITKAGRQFEAAQQAIKDVQQKYENRGLVDEVTDHLGVMATGGEHKITTGKEFL